MHASLGCLWGPDMNSILLYEPDPIKIPYLKFLLDLAHIQCTAVQGGDELLNRLELDQYNIGCYDLVVLNSLDDLVLEDRLSVIVKSSQVPIICMTSHEENIPNSVKSAIEFCSQHIFLTCIQRKLQQQSEEIA